VIEDSHGEEIELERNNMKKVKALRSPNVGFPQVVQNIGEYHKLLVKTNVLTLWDFHQFIF